MQRYQEGWEKVFVKAESEVCGPCISSIVRRVIPIRQASNSRAGLKYKAASGAEIYTYVERPIRGRKNDDIPIGMTLQVIDCKGTLGSAHRFVKAGSNMVFDEVEWGATSARHITRVEDREDPCVPTGALLHT